MSALLQERPPHRQERTVRPQEVRVGPDVLELISTAMYVDPRTLFREYLQNAADSIDDARAEGLLGPHEGEVRIELNPRGRTIRIRDNGTGLPPERFYQTLTALGSSQKRETQARGFRGIGRLSGLGYARELTFRSRVAGGPIEELTWDGRKLRSLLRDTSSELDLASLIVTATRASSIEASADEAERFFEVELAGVARLRNDVLVNADLVRAFIAEVCPVPFSEAFSFRRQIEDELASSIALANLRVFVDDDDRPITRPHQDRIELEDGRTLDLVDVETFTLPDRNGAPGAYGWLAHHAYDGAVPSPMLVKGMRARSGNVQVGDATMFIELFKEERFNSWIVGELHIVDPKIVPNARRDHFEQNAAWLHIVNQLLPIARTLSDRCRQSSIERNWRKRFELAELAADEALRLLENGAGTALQHRTLREGLDAKLMECSSVVASRHVSDADRAQFEVRYATLRGRAEGLPNSLEPVTFEVALADHSPTERKAYGRVLELVMAYANDPKEGARLVERVLDELKAAPSPS